MPISSGIMRAAGVRAREGLGHRGGAKRGPSPGEWLGAALERILFVRDPGKNLRSRVFHGEIVGCHNPLLLQSHHAKGYGKRNEAEHPGQTSENASYAQFVVTDRQCVDPRASPPPGAQSFLSTH